MSRDNHINAFSSFSKLPTLAYSIWFLVLKDLHCDSYSLPVQTVLKLVGLSLF